MRARAIFTLFLLLFPLYSVQADQACTVEIYQKKLEIKSNLPDEDVEMVDLAARALVTTREQRLRVELSLKEDIAEVVYNESPDSSSRSGLIVSRSGLIVRIDPITLSASISWKRVVNGTTTIVTENGNDRVILRMDELSEKTVSTDRYRYDIELLCNDVPDVDMIDGFNIAASTKPLTSEWDDSNSRSSTTKPATRDLHNSNSSGSSNSAGSLTAHTSPISTSMSSASKPSSTMASIKKLARRSSSRGNDETTSMSDVDGASPLPQESNPSTNSPSRGGDSSSGHGSSNRSGRVESKESEKSEVKGDQPQWEYVPGVLPLRPKTRIRLAEGKAQGVQFEHKGLKILGYQIEVIDGDKGSFWGFIGIDICRKVGRGTNVSDLALHLTSNDYGTGKKPDSVQDSTFFFQSGLRKIAKLYEDRGRNTEAKEKAIVFFKLIAKTNLDKLLANRVRDSKDGASSSSSSNSNGNSSEGNDFKNRVANPSSNNSNSNSNIDLLLLAALGPLSQSESIPMSDQDQPPLASQVPDGGIPMSDQDQPPLASQVPMMPPKPASPAKTAKRQRRGRPSKPAVPAESVPVQSVPAESVPVQSVPVQSVPAESVPADSIMSDVSRDGESLSNSESSSNSNMNSQAIPRTQLSNASNFEGKLTVSPPTGKISNSDWANQLWASPESSADSKTATSPSHLLGKRKSRRDKVPSALSMEAAENNAAVALEEANNASPPSKRQKKPAKRGRPFKAKPSKE